MLSSLGRGLIIITVVMQAACAPSNLSDKGATTEVPPTISLPRLPSVTPPALTPLPLQPSEVLTPEINLTTTLPVESGLQPLVDKAIADLAQRLSIDRKTIVVVNAQSVVWPDRSMGCPQPGMLYPQVLAEGFRIELHAGNRAYAYHGGQGRDPFLCE
ncbi:MAG TPA: hypothetical protein VLG46_06630, partial [Anaerolineae bacterium]|nr:hypothetical protein [Anaerolineae bacterium]